MDACPWVWMSSLSPAWTTARLVRSPVARIALRISPSSITIFVRITVPHIPGCVRWSFLCVSVNRARVKPWRANALGGLAPAPARSREPIAPRPGPPTVHWQPVRWRESTVFR